MINEEKLIEEIKKQDLKESMEYMSCGLTVNQYQKDIGRIFDKIISLVENQPKIGEWIPVEERLPEDEFRCLVMISNCWQQVAYYDGENWLLVCDEYCLVEDHYRKVVAWMPLHEQYRKENENE